MKDFISVQGLLERLKRYLLPMLLGMTVAYAIVDTFYIDSPWPHSILFFVAEGVLFVTFDWLKSKKILGGLIYIAMLIVALVTAMQLLGFTNYYSFAYFVDWFYLPIQKVGFIENYYYAVLLGGGFFLISVLYYFTQVRYRSFGSMLCVLFPFVIYAKRAVTMNSLYIAILITIYLAVMVHNRQMVASENNEKVVVNQSYIISIALFVSFVGAVAMIIPKPEVRSRLERDSNAFDFEVDDDNLASSYSSFSGTSSPRSGGGFTNEILFYLQSDFDTEVYYLRRQSYDTFKDNCWHANYEYDNDADLANIIPVDRQTMYDSMKKLADSGKYKEYSLSSELFSSDSLQKAKLRVFDEDFYPSYIPAPLGTITTNYANSGNALHFSYANGDMATTSNEPKALDMSLEFYPETDEYLTLAENINISSLEYADLLYQAYNNGDLTNDDMFSEYSRILTRYTVGVEYTDKMKELAFDITKDCKNDFDKAQALCDYFEMNNYVYDMEYVPSDDSIDYFVFESKTGSCTSYATAMTIMARLCGIPTRYVEGFAGYERTGDGSIAVRDINAHAFVEVYIAGAGWITFDPTVAGYMSDYSKKSNFDLAIFIEYLGKILVFLGVVFVVIFLILLDRIIELLFRISLKFSKGNRRIVRLYGHIIKLLEYSSKDDLSAYTPNMLIEYARENRGISIELIVRLFEEVCFGGSQMIDDSYNSAYLAYSEVYKHLRKARKTD